MRAQEASVSSSLQTPHNLWASDQRQRSANLRQCRCWRSVSVGRPGQPSDGLTGTGHQGDRGPGVSKFRVGTAVTAGPARDRCPRDSVPGTKGSGRAFTCAFGDSGHQVSDCPVRWPSWEVTGEDSFTSLGSSDLGFRKDGSRSIALGSEIKQSKMCWSQRRKVGLQVSGTV